MISKGDCVRFFKEDDVNKRFPIYANVMSVIRGYAQIVRSVNGEDEVEEKPVSELIRIGNKVREWDT